MVDKTSASKETKECPFCKEDILSGAIKCRYCGSIIQQVGPTHGGTCPFCKESIKPEALRCRYCHSTLIKQGSPQHPTRSATIGDCGCGCSETSPMDERERRAWKSNLIDHQARTLVAQRMVNGGPFQSATGALCRVACAGAATACFVGCEAAGSPAATAFCALICSELYDECKQGCPSYAAGTPGSIYA